MASQFALKSRTAISDLLRFARRAQTIKSNAADSMNRDAKFILAMYLLAASLGFITIYIQLPRQVFCVALLWSLAFTALGGLVGFLFGIPRVLQGDNPASVNNSATIAAPLSSSQIPPNAPVNIGYRQQVNTNLEQISDWLTKILVGVGLIKFEEIWRWIDTVATKIAEGIGQSNQPFAAALIIYFCIVGFMGNYLLTRIWLAPVLAISDAKATAISRREVIAKASADTSNVNFTAPLYADDAGTPRVSTPEVREVTTLGLGEMKSPAEVETWAKAQLGSANYEQAINGYSKLISLKPDDIIVRLEFAAALYYAGRPRKTSVEQLFEAYNLMKRNPVDVDDTLKMKIYRAITFQSLYIAAPQGYEIAIQYGEEYVRERGEQNTESAIAVNLACAYAQKYKRLRQHQAAEDEIRQAYDNALKYVRLGARGSQEWRERLRQLLVSNYPNKSPDDDDLEIFQNEKDFRQALGFDA